MIFHVLNRGNDQRTIFRNEDDYAAFLRLFGQTQESAPMRVLAYCLLSNHWHLVLWPEKDGQLAAFMQRLTTTHVRRWHLHRQSVGRGHLYQGTYKSFPVQDDEHLYSVCRYAERNALRANLVERAEEWRWCSLAQRVGRQRLEETVRLCDWPIPRPRNWVGLVNAVQTEGELDALRRSVRRGCPFGDEVWQQSTAEQLGLEYTLRPRGRPRKKP
jgi:putative transposase